MAGSERRRQLLILWRRPELSLAACVVEVEVVAAIVLAWTGLAERRDGGDDQSGVERTELGVAGVELARRAVLNQHVGFGGQLREDLASSLDAGVESQTALAGIEIEKESASLAVWPSLREGPLAASRIAFSGRLQLEDVGPQIGQELAAIRRGDAFTELENSNSIQYIIGHAARFLFVSCACNVKTEALGA